MKRIDGRRAGGDGGGGQPEEIVCVVLARRPGALAVLRATGTSHGLGWTLRGSGDWAQVQELGTVAWRCARARDGWGWVQAEAEQSEHAVGGWEHLWTVGIGVRDFGFYCAFGSWASGLLGSNALMGCFVGCCSVNEEPNRRTGEIRFQRIRN
jgi:hypothetical protein